MFETNSEGKTRLYFTWENICIGSYNDVVKYEQETKQSYWASEFFRIPEDYNPIGKSVLEIQAVDRKVFLDKVMSSVKPSSN
ncbi:hypothetical protein CAL7716_059780 [Calothrix sp. PCC 7716]|nr:hypothetical protein CAL7716_059780 [Calothrix sp. PCC 7716]